MLVHVAVAVIERNGQILVTQRHPDSHQGGYWEFPGGKLEPGETLNKALCREIREELALAVEEHIAFMQVEHDYGDKRVLLDVHRVTHFSGEPKPCEGQPMQWVALSELPTLEFPAANRPIVEKLLADLA